MKKEISLLRKLTAKDFIELYEKHNIALVIEDGRIVGFINEEAFREDE